MPELDKDFITSKIDRAHRVKGNNYGTILPAIAKCSDWTFSEQVKSNFIKASKFYQSAVYQSLVSLPKLPSLPNFN